MFNELLVGTMDFLAVFGRISKRRIEKNNRDNATMVYKHLPNGYIEDQANWSDVKFGVKSMAYSGCEIFAAYNAIYALEGKPDKATLLFAISDFEEHGAMMQGRLGVAPRSLIAYLRKHGYATKMTMRSRPENIRAMDEAGEVFVLTGFNEKRKLSKMIHTVCITKNEDGKYVAHNNYYRNATGKYSEQVFDSLEDVVYHRSKGQMICLMTITGKLSKMDSKRK